VSDEDKEKLKQTSGPLEPIKAQAKITLINKSQSAILFKVRHSLLFLFYILHSIFPFDVFSIHLFLISR